MASILKVDTIQDQSGNNIINENADTITIGASGDTIALASGATAAFGKILQVVQATHATQVVNNTITYADSGLTASITPISTSNKILVLVNQPFLVTHVGGTIAGGAIRLMRDTTVILGGDERFELFVGTTASNASMYGRNNFTFLDSPSSTDAQTYKTQLARYQAGDEMVTSPSSMEATIILMEVSG